MEGLEDIFVKIYVKIGGLHREKEIERSSMTRFMVRRLGMQSSDERDERKRKNEETRFVPEPASEVIGLTIIYQVLS